MITSAETSTREALIYSGRARLWPKSSHPRRKSHVIVGLSQRFAPTVGALDDTEDRLFGHKSRAHE